MISDGDLLLYYYRDGLDAAERERIGSALSEQPELAARLHRLIARLDAAAMTPEVPVPAHVQERWRAALSRVTTGEAAIAEKPRRETFTRLRWHMAAAAVAGVLLIVGVKVVMQSTQSGVAGSGSPTMVSITGCE